MGTVSSMYLGVQTHRTPIINPKITLPTIITYGYEIHDIKTPIIAKIQQIIAVFLLP